MFDILRALNVAMATYFAIACIPARHFWSAQREEVRFLLLGGLGLALVTGWASLEAIFQGAPPGPRVVLYLIVLSYCAYGVTRLNISLRKEPHDPPR